MLRFLLRTTVRAVAASYNTPERKGARGEHWVHKAVLSGLNKEEYHVLSDLILPVGDKTTQIDHVVLSCFGIFVIETKNMSGWIFGSGDQENWTQVLKGGKKRRFQNPLFQNYGHVKAVQLALDVDEAVLHNLVVFVGDATPKTPMPDRVAWGMRELDQLLGQRKQHLFSREEVQSFARVLNEQALENTKDVKQDHLRNLERLAEQRNMKQTASRASVRAVADCPVCNATMKPRTNRKTGEKFLGCSRFPQCKGTRPQS